MVLSSWAQFKDKILSALYLSLCDVVGTLTNVFSSHSFTAFTICSTFKYIVLFEVFRLFLVSVVWNAVLVPGLYREIQLNCFTLVILFETLIVPMLHITFQHHVDAFLLQEDHRSNPQISTRIDGASEAQGSSIPNLVPLSLPGIATITHGAGFWNDWFNALLYIKSDNIRLHGTDANSRHNAGLLLDRILGTDFMALTKETNRMAMVVVATVQLRITPIHSSNATL